MDTFLMVRVTKLMCGACETNASTNPPNKQIHSDIKKRRSFVAMLFAAGDV